MESREDEHIPFSEWMPQICPGCRYQKLPLDMPAPCEECYMGDKWESGEPEPWMLADKKSLYYELESLKLFVKNNYSINEHTS